MEKFIKYDISVEIKEENPNYGKFVIKPLENGFGNTIGNGLRRVLLSNITGYSLFAIKVPGINHEFQAIKGAKEDLIQIILNLKKLVIKIDENIFSEIDQQKTPLEKWPTLKINSKGGVIKASDIETPSGFSILNKDMYIATISKDTSFKMELYAKSGRGFVTFEENKEIIKAINTIAIDSNFSPVIRVSYLVSEIKTTKNDVNDMLQIEVVTNGSISPKDALAIGSKILIEHYKPIVSLNEDIDEYKVIQDFSDGSGISSLSISIDELELSVRSYNCLKRAGIQTIQQLTDKTRGEIEKIRNLGKKSFKEIIKKIQDRNMKLKDEQ